MTSPNPAPALSTDRSNWRWDAACSDTDPAVFFETDEASVARAKAICAACPVRVQCLETALAMGEFHGVWGGMAEGERRRLIKRRRRDARLARGARAA